MTYLNQNVVIFIHDPIKLKILILFISHHNHVGRECFLASLIDYCVINRVLGRNREETSQYATVIIQSCSQECTLIANSPTFINILSALDRCNEWGLYYTGLVTFPHVVLLNQLNWFSIIFCLQSPDSQLFPEWLRNTSSQN